MALATAEQQVASALTTLALITVPQTTAAPIVATPTRAARDVLIEADPANTATVYVGGVGLTTGTGLDLSPGDSVRFYVVDAALIHSVSLSAGQHLRAVVE